MLTEPAQVLCGELRVLRTRPGAGSMERCVIGDQEVMGGGERGYGGYRSKRCYNVVAGLAERRAGELAAGAGLHRRQQYGDVYWHADGVAGCWTGTRTQKRGVRGGAA
jgi:hypothetical protein